MKTVALKMRVYSQNVNILESRDLRKRILNTMLLSLGALVVVYVLLLANMVSNVIERRSLEAHARVLSTEVGDLELSYLSISNKINPTLSRSLGFSEAKTKFVTRQSSLGLNSPVGGALDNVKSAKNEI